MDNPALLGVNHGQEIRLANTRASVQTGQIQELLRG
jgi:hypothetical protein